MVREPSASSTSSRRDRIRRWLARLALVLALGGLVYEHYASRGAGPATIELRLGAHAGEVRRVRAHVLVDGVPVGDLDRDLDADPHTPVRFPAVTGGKPVHVIVDLSTTRGPRRVERDLAPADPIVVDVGAALDAPP